MKSTIKILIYFTAVVLLAWLLPWCYHFAFSTPSGSSFTLYSCVVDKFVSIESSGKKPVFKDFDGVVYSEGQFDSILPLFYFRQLTTNGRLPDTICGVAVTPQLISRENFIFRHSPSGTNVRSPKVYPLLETMSGRVDLQMPEDMFRMKNGIEFIDMKTNTVNPDKSDLFNKVMADKGFTWPMIDISGNPTTRKEYDQGYLLIDAAHKVFHMKQMIGRPYFRDMGVPQELGMKYAFITEFSSHRTYGFLVDKDNNLYVVNAPAYELHKLPLGTFDPATQDITIMGDMFHWTVKVRGAGGEKLYAIDASDYSLVDEYTYPEAVDKWDVYGKHIFPFELSFTSYNDKFVYPRLHSLSWVALLFNFILACGYVIIARKRKNVYLSAVFILPLGIFLFVPLLLMGGSR